MFKSIWTRSARSAFRAIDPSRSFSSRQLVIGALALLVATLPLGCSTDPRITDPVAAIFQGVVLTTSKAYVPKSGGQAELTATAVSKDGRPLQGVKVVFETTAGELSPGTEASTDEAGRARVTLSTSARAILKAKIGSMESEAKMVDVDSPVDIDIKTPGKAVAGKNAQIFIKATRKDGQPVTGSVNVQFGDGKSGKIDKFTKEATVGHTYSKTGTYKVKAELTQTAGQKDSYSENVNVGEAANEPPAVRVFGGDDDINLGQVTFLHANVSGWPVTSTLTRVTITGSQICLYHTRAGKWPAKVLSGTAVEGNPWAIAFRSGRWYAGTYEWLRPGQICKGITAGNIGGHIKRSPLSTWRPRSGEQVGFMVSTLARDSNRTSNQRTNVVVVRWP